MEGASTASTASASLDGRSLGGTDYLNLGMFGGNNSTPSSSHPSQQPSEVLVGGTAAGGGLGVLGNGFGNDSSGPSGVGAPGTSFDLNDFPSLGVSASGSNGSNELAAALRQQHQMLAHQQMLQGGGATSKPSSNNMYRLATISGNNGNFSMATEDFPALSGGPPSSSGAVNGSSLNASSLLSGGTAVNSRPGPVNGGSSGMYGGSGTELEGSSQLDGGAGLLGGTGLAGLGGLRGLQQHQPPSTPVLRTPSSGPSTGTIGSPAATSSGGAPNPATGSVLTGDYGLLGLLSVIRMTDADRNALALGSDLTMLGLNLGTVDNIYSTFSSPWSDASKPKEPHFQPPALKTGHLSKFQLETLFYIFYALPKDVLQAYAAQELYSREWRYHGELKLWFKRAAPSDGVANAAAGTTQFIYFDINSWERRLFNGNMNQNITNGFLPEEEVRVKFSSS
eukprot:scaffold1168_cov167-Amphora_coffeaeformis.AAC.36